MPRQQFASRSQISGLSRRTMSGLSQDVAGTAEWLVNKLNHDDAWNAHSIAAGLTHNTLTNIAQCFGLLDAQVGVSSLGDVLNMAMGYCSTRCCLY